MKCSVAWLKTGEKRAGSDTFSPKCWMSKWGTCDVSPVGRVSHSHHLKNFEFCQCVCSISVFSYGFCQASPYFLEETKCAFSPPTALSSVAFTPYGKYKPLTQTSNSSYWFISRTYFPRCACVIYFLVNLNVCETYVHYSGPSYIPIPFQNSWSKINFHIKYCSTGTNILKHSSGLNQICHSLNLCSTQRLAHPM